MWKMPSSSLIFEGGGDMIYKPIYRPLILCPGWVSTPLKEGSYIQEAGCGIGHTSDKKWTEKNKERWRKKN